MRRIALAFVALALVAAAFALRPFTAARVGAGFAARVTCGLVYNTGFVPGAAWRDYVRFPIGPASLLIDVKPRPWQGAVEARAAWIAGARAIHREGAGCVLVLDADEARLAAWRDPPHAPPLDPLVPWPAGDAPRVGPTPPALEAAVARAFAEPEGEPGRLRQTLAVLVAHRGRLVAERYAPGIHARTPLLSWSVAKSVVAALIGAAALEGRLDLAAPAPVPEWREPGDPRGTITLDMLLRMSSGLAFDEHYGAINDVSRMLFAESDMGAFAARMPLAHPPDSHWSYSSGTSNILARVLRERFENDVEAMVRWSRAALFEPAGMRRVIFETDTSGSFVGSSLAYASGRDWLRFGQLHLDDGVVAGRRLLPEGWSAYVSTPTPAAPEGGYGAGWWTNGGDPAAPERRRWPRLPRDTYAALGMSGQYVLVVPSARLVVVRFGLSQADDDDLHGIEPLVAAAIDALAAL